MSEYKHERRYFMPSPFSLLLETHGQTYDVERDSVIIGSYDEISNHEKSTHKPYIGFEPKLTYNVATGLLIPKMSVSISKTLLRIIL